MYKVEGKFQRPLRIKNHNLSVFCCNSRVTNKKEQMPAQRLITLNRGIQIHAQPIKNFEKNLDQFFLI